MASPAEQLAQILRDAISGALRDNKDLIKETVNVTASGGGNSGGGGSGDIVSIILSLAAIGALTDIEFLPLVEALKNTQQGGGSDGVSFTVGWFLASTLLQFAEPVTRQLTHMIESANTSMILDPAMAADMVSKEIIKREFGESEAAGGGFDKDHFSWLIQAAHNYPTVAQILLMWNRGYIKDENVTKLLTLNGVPPEWQDDIRKLHRELLTPADLALAALRRNINMDDATAGAAMWGMNETDFKVLIGNTGEPPGTMQLLEAYRRKFINKPTLVKGILQSRVRDEWVDTIEKLRYAPMSTASAANAVVRGYLTETQGADIAQQNGLEPDHWPYVLESNGRPPSHEQLATLYLRGLINEKQFKQGIRESDIKDKYIEDVFNLRVRFLPLFEARTLLNDGSITGETFANQLLVQGYQKEVIDEILKNVGKGVKVKAKHLTEAEYTEMYIEGVKNRADTIDGLKAIGYDHADADSLVTIAELKSVAKLQTELIANVRTQFMRFKLTPKQAAEKLDDIGLAPADRDRVIGGWEIVRPEGTRTLTEAQTLKALKDKAINQDDAYNRLRGLGLDDVDAKLLMEISG